MTSTPLLRRLRRNGGLLAFVGVVVLILVALSSGQSLFAHTEDPATPAPEPTMSAAEIASASGTIEVVHLVPAPADATSFTLSIDAPPNGASGPGPTQTATRLSLGAHTVSVVPAANSILQGTVSLLGVVCTSDKGVAVPVEPALAVMVHLTRPDEKITCVFQSSVTASPPAPTPTASPTP